MSLVSPNGLYPIDRPGLGVELDTKQLRMIGEAADVFPSGRIDHQLVARLSPRG